MTPTKPILDTAGRVLASMGVTPFALTDPALWQQLTRTDIGPTVIAWDEDAPDFEGIPLHRVLTPATWAATRWVQRLIREAES